MIEYACTGCGWSTSWIDRALLHERETGHEVAGVPRG